VWGLTLISSRIYTVLQRKGGSLYIFTEFVPEPSVKAEIFRDN